MLTTDRQIDRRILLAADSLETAGWQVIIIAMPLDSGTDNDQRVVRIGADNSRAKRENLVLGAYRWIRNHLPMNGCLMRLMKRLVWRYMVDPESFYTKLFYRTVSCYSPQVIVANDLPMLPVAKQVADERGARLVYDSHELYSEQEFSGHEKQRWAEIESKYIGSCNAIITVNQSIATELEQRYGAIGVNVILNAERTTDTPVRTRRFHEIYGLPSDKKVILFQGGLSAGRNLDVLVEAMHQVQNTSVVLVILGNGLLCSRLQAQAKLKYLHERVYFHPAVPQIDLLEYTAAADVGVIPYLATCLNNYFCTPNKLFEFIAAGIPILGSDLPEIRKLVEGQQIGLVGDMSTPQKLAALIDTFFGDERRLAAWQSNVLTARKRICWEEEEKKLIAIYEPLR